jgi:hypothetical protein
MLTFVMLSVTFCIVILGVVAPQALLDKLRFFSQTLRQTKTAIFSGIIEILVTNYSD